jgi:hypothetical protein
VTPPSGRSADQSEERRLEVAAKLARLLDDRFLDPLLGLLLPGVGDVVGAALGLYTVYVAFRLRASKVLIARMLLNLSVDLLGGLVPVVGDIWDFFFKANRRNVDLLRTRLQHDAGRSTIGDALLVGAAALLFLVAVATPVVLVWAVIRWLGHGQA